MRRRGEGSGERIRDCFSILWGYWKMTAAFDASHGAFLLDHISLNENGRTGQGMATQRMNFIKKKNGRILKAMWDPRERTFACRRECRWEKSRLWNKLLRE